MLVLEVSTADAEIITAALEAALAGTDSERRAHVEMLRDDITRLAPHPGIIVDLTTPSAPRVAFGAPLSIPVVVVPPDGGPLLHREHPEVDRDAVLRAMLAAQAQEEPRPAVDALSDALIALQRESIGHRADATRAWKILDGLIATLNAMRPHAPEASTPPPCARPR